MFHVTILRFHFSLMLKSMLKSDSMLFWNFFSAGAGFSAFFAAALPLICFGDDGFGGQQAKGLGFLLGKGAGDAEAVANLEPRAGLFSHL